MGSAYDRSFYVITATGDRGPYTRDEVRALLQQGEITSTCRLRSAAARDLGTVGELLRHPPRRSSEPRLVPIQQPLTIRLLILLGLTILVGGVVLAVSKDGRGDPIPLTPPESSLPPITALPLPPDMTTPADRPGPKVSETTTTPLRPIPLVPRPASMTPTPSTGLSVPSSVRHLLGCDPQEGMAGLINRWDIRDDERGGISLHKEDGVTFVRLASQGDHSCMLRKDLTIDSDLRTVSVRARVRATVGQIGQEPWFLPRIILQWGHRREDRHETAIQWRKTTPWQDIDRSIRVPEGSTMLRVWVGTNRCTGHLDLAHLDISSP